MSDSQSGTVPRTPEGPSTSDILEAMTLGEPYKAADLDAKYDEVSRWTIQRRLEALHENDEIRRKKHADGSVTWWRPES